MIYFIIGLLIFLGTHSVRIFADDWRTSQISRLGVIPWKLAYGLVSAIGFGLIVWGFSIIRPESFLIWAPPAWTRHAAALLTLPAFILIVAAYIPGTRIRAGVGHPMALGVVLWALGHLIANGYFIDQLLFAAFFFWAMLDYYSSLARDKKANTSYPAGTLGRTLLTVVIGFAGWVIFAGFLHFQLIGVRPFG
ncbi:MAG: NnrU family protein [Sterolibacterium sp.]